MAEKNLINWERTNRPVVVSAKEAEQRSYVFFEQAKKIRLLLNGFEQDAKEKSGTKHEIAQEENRTISIIGERGTGKSSLLRTAKNILEEREYYVLGPIDPSAFNDSMQICELLLSSFYSEIVNKNKKCENISSCEANLYKKIKACNKTLINIRLSKDASKEYLESNTDLEVLNDYENRHQFQEILAQLTKEFLSWANAERGLSQANYKHLAVLIDDLDMVENKQIFQMVEDIRKFISSSATVVLAFREHQLNNAVLQNIVSSNELLLNKNIVDLEELQKQAARYMEKFAPEAKKVYLQGERELYKRNFSEMAKMLFAGGESKGEDSYMPMFNEIFLTPMGLDAKSDTLSMEGWIVAAIQAKVRLDITPVDQKELSRKRLPGNLRGLWGLVRIIVEMPTPSSKGTLENQVNTISTNVETYRSYLKAHAIQCLNIKEYEMLKGWENTPTENKNYYIYREMWRNGVEDRVSEYNKVDDAEAENAETEKAGTAKSKKPKFDEKFISLLLDVNLVQPQNVAIADVHIMLSEYRNVSYTKSGDNYFVYLMKVMYSFELITLYLQGFKNAFKRAGADIKEDSFADDDFDEYLTLLNSYIIPRYVLDGICRQFKNLSFEFQYKKEYSVEFTKEEKDLHLNSDMYNKKQFFRHFSYECFPARGNVLPGALPRLQRRSSRDQFIYPYRKSYSFACFDDSMKDGDIFNYDPFAFLGKAWNVLRSAKNFHITDEQYKSYRYVLTSFFDIDRFVIHNYTKNENVEPLLHVLNQINRKLQLQDSDENLNLPDFSNKSSLLLSMPVFVIEETGILSKKAYGTVYPQNNLQINSIAESWYIPPSAATAGAFSVFSNIDFIDKSTAKSSIEKALEIVDLPENLKERLKETQARLNNNNTRVSVWDKQLFRDVELYLLQNSDKAPQPLRPPNEKR